MVRKHFRKKKIRRISVGQKSDLKTIKRNKKRIIKRNIKRGCSRNLIKAKSKRFRKIRPE